MSWVLSLLLCCSKTQPPRLVPVPPAGDYLAGCLASGRLRLLTYGPEADGAQENVVVGMAAYEANRLGVPYFAFKEDGAPMVSSALTRSPVGTVDPAPANPMFLGRPMVEVVLLRCVPMDSTGEPAQVFRTEEVLHLSPWREGS